MTILSLSLAKALLTFTQQTECDTFSGDHWFWIPFNQTWQVPKSRSRTDNQAASLRFSSALSADLNEKQKQPAC